MWHQLGQASSRWSARQDMLLKWRSWKVMGHDVQQSECFWANDCAGGTGVDFHGQNMTVDPDVCEGSRGDGVNSRKWLGELSPQVDPYGKWIAWHGRHLYWRTDQISQLVVAASGPPFRVGTRLLELKWLSLFLLFFFMLFLWQAFCRCPLLPQKWHATLTRNRLRHRGNQYISSTGNVEIDLFWKHYQWGASAGCASLGFALGEPLTWCNEVLASLQMLSP